MRKVYVTKINQKSLVILQDLGYVVVLIGWGKI